MKRAALNIAAMLPLACCGQWPTNAPGAFGRTAPWVKCTWSATVERARAAYGDADYLAYMQTDAADDLAIHFGTSTELRRRKAELKAMLSGKYWVDYSRASDGEFADVEQRTGGGNAAFPRICLTNSAWSTNILDVCGLPANYFDATPYFGLSSSSNGWTGITNIVARMRWLHDATTFPNVSNVNTFGDGLGATFAEATNAAISNVTYTTSGGEAFADNSRWAGGAYSANIRHGSKHLSYGAAATNGIDREMDAYLMLTQTNATAEVVVDEPDSMGDLPGAFERWNRAYTQAHPVHLAWTSSVPVGRIMPAGPFPTTNNTRRGYYIFEGINFIHKYDAGANGFQFK